MAGQFTRASVDASVEMAFQDLFDDIEDDRVRDGGQVAPSEVQTWLTQLGLSALASSWREWWEESKDNDDEEWR